MTQVRNREVWNQIRVLFIGSAVLFLINIYFGFDNALTAGILPRWQALIHLHAGSIGWITLSLIGLAIWIFTGEREVSDRYVSRVRAFTYVALGVFGAYIASFGLAFSRGGGTFALLPVFGTAATLVIWLAAIYALNGLRHQPVTTTMHILVAGGLMVAAVGATMGLLLGLEYALGKSVLPIATGDDRVGVHAGMMESYIILVAAGIIEGTISSGPAKRWTRAGLLQTLFLSAAALLVPFGYLVHRVTQLVPLFGLLLGLGLVTFLVRTGRWALAYNPLLGGIRARIWFGSFWAVVTVALLIYAAVTFAEDISIAPPWFYVVFSHSAYVGMMTNLLLAVHVLRTSDTSQVLAWGEPVSMWLMNLGLLVFFALKIAADNRLGAIVMGIGVLLGVATMLLRLSADRPAVPAAAGASGLPRQADQVRGEKQQESA